MISFLLSRIVILVFGTLYPAYASYKALKSNDIHMLSHWITYWVVSTLFFTLEETILNLFLFYEFPFYYEFKIIFVIWLLYPVAKGSQIVYKEVICPYLTQYEAQIDQFLDSCKKDWFTALFQLGCSLAALVVISLIKLKVEYETYHCKYQKWNSGVEWKPIDSEESVILPTEDVNNYPKHEEFELCEALVTMQLKASPRNQSQAPDFDGAGDSPDHNRRRKAQDEKLVDDYLAESID